MKLRTRIAYLRWHLKDYVIFPLRRYISSALAWFAYGLIRTGAKERGLALLMKSDRVGPSHLSRALVKSSWDDLVLFSKCMVLQTANPGVEWIQKRSLVLKDPLVDEAGQVKDKGVYLVKFTTTFPDVFHHFELKRLQHHFHVVLEPSWAGYCLPEILSWSSLSAPVVVEASEPEDRALLESLETNLVPVSFGSGDWVDPQVFRPLEGVEKEYDVIYVANFNSIKRQYVFLKVLRDLMREGVSLRAALVCGEWGECREEILDLIEEFGLSEELRLFENISQSELNVLLNKSKVNVLLSLKEGSNRSLFEGFFAGTPGIVLANNVGVNKEYFNSQTGACISESDLGETLLFFSENWHTFCPREWAEENISPSKTTDKLASAIRKFDPGFGCNNGASGKISVKVNAPEAEIWSEELRTPTWNVNEIMAHCGGSDREGGHADKTPPPS
ncbi:glycosyltransferase [Marinobacter sp. CHS3-4]|uniref:glycosyltransferase n=1 Tax=Marinobacter sp. CHS3-4 TaxID=3045174 RepID=UPI0024B54570|nr:glycosyltransferase [Marinobacter sp. CHS3-4]MDI9245576.1 glycosyltransferase [Marinobacter sp. CHS3-4]